VIDPAAGPRPTSISVSIRETVFFCCTTDSYSHMSADEGIRVLYVDDESEFADLVAYWLRHDDGDPSLSVTLAEDAAEALDVLSTEAIDCVVSDYDMPGADGLDLLADIREGQSALPFILFTARGGEEIARDAFRAGVTDYMTKDGDREVVGLLAERVRKAVAERGTGGGRSADDHLEYRAGVRDIALDAATSLMSATPDELDAKVRFTLQTVCEYMEVGRAATYVEADDGSYECRHEWHADALPETLDPDGEYDDWFERLEVFNTVRYGEAGRHPGTGDVTPPTDRSGVVAPMIAEWSLAGVAVFDDPSCRVWSDEEVNLVETITELIARAVERREQQLRLRKQNDRLEQFASVVSHDLRNPINVADGWLDLAREGDDEGFERVQNSLDRMEGIIDDVLTLARDGSDVGETEPVEVGEVAETAWRRVDTREATLSVEEIGEIQADEGRLSSVFENLFRNAVEHGGHGVGVTVGPLANGGFFVEDDGPGIPEDEGDDLFEWGKTTESDGSGLGLAIVETVAEGHGWSVAVVDGSEAGARFEFST
jgi:CheY-like chemotaxis protein